MPSLLLPDDFTPPELPKIDAPVMPDISPSQKERGQGGEAGDLFSTHRRKAWDKSVEARCDFTRRIRITRRSGIFFITLWQKSLYGMTLTEIKADESKVPYFADNLAPLILDILGEQLAAGGWCIITTPKRRHKVRNFATNVAIRLAEALRIPFYEDVCTCRNRKRMDAIFDVQHVPPETNIICFDDFVTTGQTLLAMKRAFAPYHKNMVFFAGINNKL